MQAMTAVFEQVDMYVGGADLGICNLTGHPTIAFPTIMDSERSHPQPICATMTGRLYDEASLLTVAAIVEQHADVTRHRPPAD